MPGNDQEQRAVLHAVDSRDVVHLHGNHAEDFVGGVLERRAHPVFGAISHAKEAPFLLGDADPLGVDQKRLARSQHLARERQA
jgi:hypothetical protein